MFRNPGPYTCSFFFLLCPFFRAKQKYDVGQQTHLPFQGVENNFSSNVKRALEAKLRAAIDNERSSRASGGKVVADTMDTDDGGDNNTGGAQSKKRERGGRPTRSTSAAAAVAAAAAAGGSGVKRESTGGGKKEPAAFPKVYTLSDFKSYQEMKRQVCVACFAWQGADREKAYPALFRLELRCTPQT